MISGAATAPRICSACRFMLVHRTTISRQLQLPRREEIRWRHHGRSRRAPGKGSPRKTEPKDRSGGIRNKDDVEALIRGFAKPKIKLIASPSKDAKVAPIQETSHVREEKHQDVESPLQPTTNTTIELQSAEPKMDEVDVEEESTETQNELPEHIGEDEGNVTLPIDAEGEQELLLETQPSISEAELTEGSPTEEILTAKRRWKKDTRGTSAHVELLLNRPLGVSALGVPVEALVIKNPNQMRQPRKPISHVAEELKATGPKIDWQNLTQNVEGEEEIDSQKEAMVNIDELRPKDTKVLRMRDFEKLSQKLFIGFTGAQLQEYYKNYQLANLPSRETPTDFPWALKHIAWIPTSALQIASGTPKQTLAHSIILNKWGMTIQENTDGLGRAFVWVRPDIYPILVQGSNPVIEKLRKAFLDEESNERISTTSEAYRLNIAARKSSTYAILEKIDELYRTVRHRTVALKEFTDEIPSSAELNELALITNTIIKPVKTGKDVQLQIVWFAEDRIAQLDEQSSQQTPNSEVEDLGDIALRLLLTRPQEALSHDAQIIPPPTKDDSSAATYTRFYRETRSMSWREKIQQWTRYVKPVEKNAASEPTPLDLAGGTLSVPAISSKKDIGSVTTTATFGHILHSESQADPTKLSKHLRILAPVVPHPAALASLKPDGEEASTRATTVVINFAPANGHSDSIDSKAPFVQLRLPVNPDADLGNLATLPTNASLQGVVIHHAADALLPSESVDVHLSQQKSLPLKLEKQAPLRDFLASSQLNLLDGHLHTPSRVQLAIPNTYLKPKSRSVKSTDIPYLFRGLEIHQTISMKWNTHTLAYTTIEAGQHGGSRQELTLNADPSVPFKGAQRESYLEHVQELATGVHFSWDEGFRAMKTQRFDDHSYDLPEDGDSANFEAKKSNVREPKAKRFEAKRFEAKPFRPEEGPTPSDFFRVESAPLPTMEYSFEEKDDEIFAGMEAFSEKEKTQFRRDFEAALELDAEFEAEMNAQFPQGGSVHEALETGHAKTGEDGKKIDILGLAE